MIIRSTVTSLLVLLLPLVVRGQEAKSVGELSQEIEVLRADIKRAASDLLEMSKKVENNTAATIENSKGIERLAGVINDGLTRQQELFERIDALTKLQQEQLVQQQQVLDAITQRDSQGNEVLRLSANMEKSEEFRQDMRQAVNESIQKEGDVIIHNKMPSQQRIKVNQTEYDIPAGETLTLKVPVGTLTAQLPGQRLTNWTVHAPQYKQAIDIVPDTEATVIDLSSGLHAAGAARLCESLRDDLRRSVANVC